MTISGVGVKIYFYIWWEYLYKSNTIFDFVVIFLVIYGRIRVSPHNEIIKRNLDINY